MEISSLEELLETLEKDRKIRICVFFQENYDNMLLARSAEHRHHSAAVCRTIMKKKGDYRDCYRCRSVVQRLVTRRKKAVSGCCPNGVFEYCSPVIYQDKVVAVIFIGNILLDDQEKFAKLSSNVGQKLLQTMESGYSLEDCSRAARLVGSYITLLLDAYGSSDSVQDPLVEKMKQYIFQNFTFGFSAADIAEEFGYNEKYLGRIFKERSGQSIKEYCNALKINEAKKLLLTTDLPVSEISCLTGYNNITYFNYVFGKQTGMSPTRYRESAANTSR